MARVKKAAPELHGAKKKQFQFMLTEQASELIDTTADKLGLTRSEVLERAIRAGSLEFASDYSPQAAA